MPSSALILIFFAAVNSTIGNMLLKQSRLAAVAGMPGDLTTDSNR